MHIENANYIYMPSSKPEYQLDYFVKIIEDLPECDAHPACYKSCAMVARLSITQNSNVIEELTDLPVVWSGNWCYSHNTKKTEWVCAPVYCADEMPIKVIYDEKHEHMVFKTIEGERFARVHITHNYKTRTNGLLQFKSTEDAIKTATQLTAIIKEIQDKKAFNEPSVDFVASRIPPYPELPWVHVGTFYDSMPIVVIKHGDVQDIFAYNDPTWQSIIADRIKYAIMLDITNLIRRKL